MPRVVAARPHMTLVDDLRTSSGIRSCWRRPPSPRSGHRTAAAVQVDPQRCIIRMAEGAPPFVAAPALLAQGGVWVSESVRISMALTPGVADVSHSVLSIAAVPSRPATTEFYASLPLGQTSARYEVAANRGGLTRTGATRTPKRSQRRCAFDEPQQPRGSVAHGGTVMLG